MEFEIVFAHFQADSDGGAGNADDDDDVGQRLTGGPLSDICLHRQLLSVPSPFMGHGWTTAKTIKKTNNVIELTGAFGWQKGMN